MSDKFAPPGRAVPWHILATAKDGGHNIQMLARNHDLTVLAQTWFEARRKAIVLLAQHGILTDDPVLEMEDS